MKWVIIIHIFGAPSSVTLPISYDSYERCQAAVTYFEKAKGTRAYCMSKDFL